MSETAFAPITTIGLDLSKAVFPVHGTDAADEVIVRRGLSRARVLSFFDSGANDVGKGGQQLTHQAG